MVIRESSKRKELMFGCDEVVTILAICPTRWGIRAVAVRRVCSAYREIIEALEKLKDDKIVRGDTKPR